MIDTPGNQGVVPESPELLQSGSTNYILIKQGKFSKMHALDSGVIVSKFWWVIRYQCIVRLSFSP